MKKTISTILAVSVIFSQIIGINVMAEDAPLQNDVLTEQEIQQPQLLGKFSISDINYSLYDDKRLVIDYDTAVEVWMDIDALSIGDYSYAYGDIQTVEFSDRVKIIPDSALAYRSLITKIIIPEGVTSIGKNAFTETGITQIKLPSTLNVIDNYAFKGSALTKIEIPASVTLVGSHAFVDCTTLGEVVINSENTVIGELAIGFIETETGLVKSNVKIYSPANSIAKTYSTITGVSFEELSFNTEPSPLPELSPEPELSPSPEVSPEPETSPSPETSPEPEESPEPLPEGTYSITYVLNGGTIYNNAPTTYTSDSKTIRLYTPTREGYRFYQWYKDSNYKTPISEIKTGSEGNITLYATWIKPSSGSLGTAKFIVRFNTNGGTEVSAQTVVMNQRVVKPDNPTRENYKFAGWYSDSSLHTKYDFDKPVKSTMILYAKWISVDEDDAPIYDDDETKTLIVLMINSKNAKVNGKTVENDVAPFIKNDRTMVPIRFISEALGAEVEYDHEFRMVTIKDGSRQIVINIDSDRAYVNGEVCELDAPAFIDDDRTFIPIRFVAEALECEVDWDEVNKKVTITR